MKTRELSNLGIPRGELMKIAQKAVDEYAKSAKGSIDRNELRQVILRLVQNPEDFIHNKYLGELAGLSCSSLSSPKTVRFASESIIFDASTNWFKETVLPSSSIR